MSDTEITLLGGLQIKRDGSTETQFRSRRAVALLAYLIVNHNRPIPRAELVELIWPDKTEQQGRSNLRWVLNYLSKLVPDGLEKTRQTVQFALDVEQAVDTHAIARAMKGDDLDLLSSLLLEAQGEYMSGFFFNESAEFETWLITQRETWRLRLLEYYENLITYFATTNEYDKGLAFAQKWLAVEPWSEPAHCWTMRLLSRMGRTDQALEQYERCWRILAEELGTEPTDETTALYQRLLQTADTPRHNLPAQPTEFVGREAECAEIINQLSYTETRLITILGPGGMGKTRLAIQAAESLVEAFIDGVIFVDLTRITSPTDIPNTILNALTDNGIISSQAAGSVAAARVLRQALHEREVLIVLDNFEHVIEGATHLTDLIQDVPQVKFIVTSRERLNLRWERLIEISGLPLLNAFNLFVLTARRARPTFTVSTTNRRCIESVCEMVEGMPLAIELAAGWTRMQTCSHIAETIRNNLEFLTTTQRDMPDRHRSVSAVFQSSWERLSQDEQERLGRLAIFTGGFSAESAQAVADASWSSLAPLVDKSLITQSLSTDSGGSLVRYKMHELLRQFSASKLTSQMADPARDKHAEWFCQLLLKHSERIKEGDRVVLNKVAREISNIKQAWRWSIQTGAVANLGAAFEPLGYFFDMRSRWQESEVCFSSAVAMLRPLAANDPLANIVLTGCVLSLGNTLTRTMAYDSAEKLLREGLEMSRALHHQPAIAFSLFALARVRGFRDDIDEARQLYIESQTLAASIKDLPGEARATVNLSSTAMYMGEWETGKQLAETSYAQFERVNDQRGRAVALLNQSRGALADGNLTSARTFANQSHLLADDSGAVSIIGSSKLLLAEIAYAENRLNAAQTHLNHALGLFSQIGEDNSVIEIWYWHGRIALLKEEFDDAHRHAHRLLQLSEHLNWDAGIVLGYELLGRIATGRDSFLEARDHLLKALDQLKSTPYAPLTLRLFEAMLPVCTALENALSGILANILHKHPAATNAQRLSVAEHVPAPGDYSIEEAIGLLKEAEKK